MEILICEQQTNGRRVNFIGLREKPWRNAWRIFNKRRRAFVELTFRKKGAIGEVANILCAGKIMLSDAMQAADPAP